MRNGDHGDIGIVVTVASSPPITVALWPIDTSNSLLYTQAGVIEGSYKLNYWVAVIRKSTLAGMRSTRLAHLPFEALALWDDHILWVLGRRDARLEDAEPLQRAAHQ